MTEPVAHPWDRPDGRIADVLQRRAGALAENLAQRVRKNVTEDLAKWPKQLPLIVGRYMDFLVGFCVVVACELTEMDDEAFERSFTDLVKLKFTLLRDAKRRAAGG
jgi:hypothetical protein